MLTASTRCHVMGLSALSCLLLMAGPAVALGTASTTPITSGDTSSTTTTSTTTSSATTSSTTTSSTTTSTATTSTAVDEQDPALADAPSAEVPSQTADGPVEETVQAVEAAVEPVTAVVEDVVAPEPEPEPEPEPASSPPSDTQAEPAGEGDDSGASTAQPGNDAESQDERDPAPVESVAPTSAPPAASAPVAPPAAAPPAVAPVGVADPASLDQPDTSADAVTDRVENWVRADVVVPGAPPAIGFLPLAFATSDSPRSTTPIIDILGSADPSMLARVLTPFPVAGHANYSDDWGAPRLVPTPHPHAGTDIFAPRGTPVIATVAGTVGNVRYDSAVGGNSLRLTAADGTFFYFAHLEGFATGISSGTPVMAGQTMGFVGDSGNAVGTPPHLHYEIHPQGGGPVSPVPYLDRWLSEAMTTAGLVRAAAPATSMLGLSDWLPGNPLPAAAPGPVEVTSSMPALRAGVLSVPVGVANAIDPAVALLAMLAAGWLLAAPRRSTRLRFAAFGSLSTS